MADKNFTLHDTIQQRERARREDVDDPPGDNLEDDFFLHDYATKSNYDPVDLDCDDGDIPQPGKGYMPATNAGEFGFRATNRNQLNTVPGHVLLNQVSSCCMRFNARIKGLQAQTNFVQRVVSTVSAMSFPLMYLGGSLFPHHYYSEATHNKCAILGVAPLRTFQRDRHPTGSRHP